MSRLTRLHEEIHKQQQYTHKYLATGVFLGISNNVWTKLRGYPAHSRPNSLWIPGLLKALEELNQDE